MRAINIWEKFSKLPPRTHAPLPSLLSPFLRQQFIFERIFAPSGGKLPESICHLFDNFCHQLAAKSTSAKTTKSKRMYVEPSSERWLSCARLSPAVSLSMRNTRDVCFPIAPLGKHHIVINSPQPSAIDQCGSPFAGRDWRAGLNCLVFPYQELCQVICWLQPEFTSRRQQPNEAAKLLGELLAPWWDAKWKAGATHAVCYHSICLKPQTGHYPAIILVDLQSRWMKQLLWLVQSPGGEMGTSL